MAKEVIRMGFGSDGQVAAHEGECRTTEDVGLLFARYRAEARHYAEMVGEETESEPAVEPDRPAETVLSGR